MSLPSRVKRVQMQSLTLLIPYSIFVEYGVFVYLPVLDKSLVHKYYHIAFRLISADLHFRSTLVSARSTELDGSIDV
jgi:hypothetical protein